MPNACLMAGDSDLSSTNDTNISEIVIGASHHQALVRGACTDVAQQQSHTFCSHPLLQLSGV